MREWFFNLGIYLATVALGYVLWLIVLPASWELADLARLGINDFLMSGDTTVLLDQENDPRASYLSSVVFWTQIGFLFGPFIAAAFMLPKAARAESVVNCATAVALALLTSKIVTGFPLFDFKNIFLWGAAGLVIFLAIVAIRSRRNSPVV